jgi:hypothetical protein
LNARFRTFSIIEIGNCYKILSLYLLINMKGFFTGDSMGDYSLGLALFDYFPVALSALGLCLLAGLLSSALPGSKLPIWSGVVLVVAGGLSKASWKLTWVLTQQDVALLNNLLFILMAPGMILLASYTASASSHWRGAASSRPQLRATILIALALGASLALALLQPHSRAWFFTLLAAASLANISISALLIGLSWRAEEKLTALIFLLSVALILSLSGLSRISAGSAPLQWLAEILNTLAHGSFALAVWRLRKVIPLRAGSVSSSQ